ncbi:hypothetical protein ACFW1A_20890 [Kitasatospora sp. NPDC058965]|uniref:hypothetical protein n=1 Tax=Kitasatospora sp. NPDC058965 TaxID=3346682 RepID=UPI003675A672
MTTALPRATALLGDPEDPANPLGFAAAVEADERRELPEPAALDRTEEFLQALGARDLGLVLGRALAPALTGDPTPAAHTFAVGGPLRARRSGRVLLLDGEVHATGPRRLLLTVELDGAARHLQLPAELRPSVGAAYRTPGLRGCRPHRLVFTAHPVPVTALVDAPADRAAEARALAAATIGALDTQLRTTLRFAERRELYGRPVIALPSARAVLAEAFADLLTADRCRAEGVTAPVEQLVRDAGHRLSLLLGARSYLREGEHAIFQKHQRDLTTLAALRGPRPGPGEQQRREAAEACRRVRQRATEPLLREQDRPAGRTDRTEALLAELRHRLHSGRSFDLSNRPVN